MKLYVTYYRFCTQEPGSSGLGLDLQKAAVKDFVASSGSIIAEFLEIESSKKDNRVELQKAIAAAKKYNATLIIAKIDRLSRNTDFIFTLKNSGVDFVCTDMPDANTNTVGIFAVMAQHEHELISKRTKEALASKKARGEKVGNPSNFTAEGRKNGSKARRNKALANKQNEIALTWCLKYRNQQLSLNQIAEKLNNMGLNTSTGKKFTAMGVKRLLDRHKAQLA